MAHLFETMLGRLGSRLTLDFQPRENRILYSALGKYFDLPLPLEITFTYGRAQRAFPFSEGAGLELVEQLITPTSLTFRCRSREMAVMAEMSFLAPFYPRDVQTSCLPAYILTFRWEPWGRVEPQAAQRSARITIRHRGDPLSLREDTQPIRWWENFSLKAPHWLDRAGPPDSFNRRNFRAEIGLQVLAPEPTEATPDTLAIDLQAGEDATLLLAAHCADDVLEVLGQPYRFKYVTLWQNLDAVIAYARENVQFLRSRSSFFDSLLAQASIGKCAHDLIAFSLQSYLQNTWWTVGRDGHEWFSCWEGNCTYHSTVDVEYNLAWFYLLLWPELLELTLDEWAMHEKYGAPEQEHIYVAYELENGAPPPTETSWLSHDMGALLTVNGQSYPHEMEIEENCNFVLLLHALAHFTGNQELFSRHWPMVRRLAKYIMAADTTGDGIPNMGVANTIDDASPAVQYSREQVYLGFKSFCALHAAAAVADRLGEKEFAATCREFAQRTNATLQHAGWASDHFAVCLERTAEGLRDVWTGQPISGELVGWDAYHIYAANGFLYLLATDLLPSTDYERLRTDIQNARQAAMCEYGDFHSSADHSNLWVSQNLHRDFVGAYLGIDPGDMAERYWAFELLENVAGRGGAFVDTYGWNHLHYYPRGITSLGLIYALGGIRLSKLDGKLLVSPVRVPCRLPLLSLADWDAQRVPWIEARLSNARVEISLTEPDLLAGLSVGIPTNESHSPVERDSQ
jgi:hypothetical protein